MGWLLREWYTELSKEYAVEIDRCAWTLVGWISLAVSLSDFDKVYLMTYLNYPLIHLSYNSFLHWWKVALQYKVYLNRQRWLWLTLKKVTSLTQSSWHLILNLSLEEVLLKQYQEQQHKFKVGSKSFLVEMTVKFRSILAATRHPSQQWWKKHQRKYPRNQKRKGKAKERRPKALAVRSHRGSLSRWSQQLIRSTRRYQEETQLHQWLAKQWR